MDLDLPSKDFGSVLKGGFFCSILTAFITVQLQKYQPTRHGVKNILCDLCDPFCTGSNMRGINKILSPFLLTHGEEQSRIH